MMTGAAHAQDIETPWVRVDTGNDGLDLAFVLIVIFALAAAYVVVKRLTRRR